MKGYFTAEPTRCLLPEMISGVVLVISSSGEAYERMEEAWMVSWHRQAPQGLVLAFLSSGDCCEVEISPTIWRLNTEGTDSWKPGILDKTVAGLTWASHRYPDAWIFRTNLSSYVELEVLACQMAGLSGHTALGYSPTFDHLSGCGFGVTAETTRMLLKHKHLLETDLIDDVAISRLLARLGCTRRWTGRIDRVWPEGLVRHGVGPWYHVRVKGQDRLEDSQTLHELAKRGIGAAEAWFSVTQTPTGFPAGSPPPLLA